MKPVLRAVLWMIGGCVLLTCALLIPAHFRAVDVKVLERAGASGASLVQAASNFLNLEKIAPARLLWRAGEMLQVSGHRELGAPIAQALSSNPSSAAGHGPATLESLARLFREPEAPPIFEQLMDPDLREKVITLLQTSRRPGVQTILQNRMLTNTVHFPPVLSSSGQPLEAVIAMAALLSQADLLPTGLREKIEFLAAHANNGGSVDALETVYLDFLSLGQRLEGAQMVEFIRRLEDTTTLHDLAETVRATETELPILFSAVTLAQQPSRVARYLAKFPKTGLPDLGVALFRGQAALNELLDRQHRVYSPAWRLKLIGYDPFGAFFYAMIPATRSTPAAAMLLKCFVLLAGLFCCARALAILINGPQPAGLNQPDRTRLIQDLVFALCVFAVALFTIEPFIVSETTKVPSLPIRLRLPLAGSATVSPITKTNPTNQLTMSTATLASLLIFFVLQALIYVFCLTKISEIRRQAIEPRIKLRLLENEEHLFDAGLYVGLVGTIISLIVYSLGLVKPSLMAAYSATSFGIIFVCVLKIFHVRPLRRQLILESEPLS